MKRDGNNNMKDRRPEYWESMTKKNRGYFPLSPLIAPLLIIVVTIVVYYLILANELFPTLQQYIYWAVKIIIGFEILAASARTLWAPILGILVGIGLYFAEQSFNLTGIAGSDALQLIGVSAVGFLVTFIVKV